MTPYTDPAGAYAPAAAVSMTSAAPAAPPACRNCARSVAQRAVTSGDDSSVVTAARSSSGVGAARYLTGFASPDFATC